MLAMFTNKHIVFQVIVICFVTEIEYSFGIPNTAMSQGT